MPQRVALARWQCQRLPRIKCTRSSWLPRVTLRKQHTKQNVCQYKPAKDLYTPSFTNVPEDVFTIGKCINLYKREFIFHSKLKWRLMVGILFAFYMYSFRYFVHLIQYDIIQLMITILNCNRLQYDVTNCALCTLCTPDSQFTRYFFSAMALLLFIGNTGHYCNCDEPNSAQVESWKPSMPLSMREKMIQTSIG